MRVSQILSFLKMKLWLNYHFVLGALFLLLFTGILLYRSKKASPTRAELESVYRNATASGDPYFIHPSEKNEVLERAKSDDEHSILRLIGVSESPWPNNDLRIAVALEELARKGNKAALDWQS